MNLNKAPEPLKILCSYGGKILPRHSNGTLRYDGGHNRVLAVDSSSTCTELMEKLKEFSGYYSDEDLANIIEEYGRASFPPRPLKIRAILAPPKSPKQISPPTSTVTSGGDSSHSKLSSSIFSCLTKIAVVPRFAV
ncbi:hypothetical protein PS1_007556 [Malus domestica]